MYSERRPRTEVFVPEIVNIKIKSVVYFVLLRINLQFHRAYPPQIIYYSAKSRVQQQVLNDLAVHKPLHHKQEILIFTFVPRHLFWNGRGDRSIKSKEDSPAAAAAMTTTSRWWSLRN